MNTETLNPEYMEYFESNEDIEIGNDDMDVNKDRNELEDGEMSESDSDIPLDDIDSMLEESLQRNKSNDPSMPVPEEKKKTVLKKREQDYFEMLPEGWIEVTHYSGMPVYLQKQTRVCTMAKPYYLGPGSARKHEIPMSAIPCLAYKKQLEKESQQSEAIAENNLQAQHSVNETENISNSLDSESNKNSTSNMPPPIIAKVESIQDAKKEKSLHYLTVREYCQNVFQFQDITIRKFKTWKDRRKHVQLRKIQQRPSLPEGTKLITCPLKSNDHGDPSGRNTKKEFVMNPAGKSSVCILHEFVQHAERVQPKYIFKELENASMPYSATVVINNMEYGVGYGSSKKQAKSEAARATLEILIPEIKDMNQNGTKKGDAAMQDLTFFDEIKVDDDRVSEMCVKAGQHSPYQILVECLKRNYGMGDTEIKHDVKLIKHQLIEFTMTVGKHTATVKCKNKRDGKQKAAQAILQLLHPQIASWGSLLRLYGRGSCKTPKEKKEEEQKITELQNTACANRPNYAILKKLKEEMLKLREKTNLDETKEPLRLILCSNNYNNSHQSESSTANISSESRQMMQDFLYNNSDLNDINSDSD